jgi:Lrp/AsnC family leucine-responsive transcriptional regulator
MKLTPAEQKVLGTVQLRADATVPELCKLTKLRPHQVRYCLNKLIAIGLLRRRVIIDPYQLGYAIYGFWFSLASAAHRSRQAIEKYLSDHSEVSYLGEFGGAYEYKIDILAKTPRDAGRVLSSISERFGEVFGARALIVTVSLSDYPHKYLAPEQTKGRVVTIGSVNDKAVDDVDHKILKALSTIDDKSLPAIARKVGIPSTSMDYRIKGLEKENIIVGHQYWTEIETMNTLGMFSFVHRISLRKSDSKALLRMAEFANEDPAVYSMTVGIGEWDIEICTSVSSQRDEREFKARLENALEGLLDTIDSVPVVKNHKVSNYPFR